MGWFRQLFSRRRRYDELSESIREHFDEKLADLMDRGMTREQAERTARREFGNVMRIEERSREVWQWSWLESILPDLRLILRRLARSPGFTATVLLTLAIGIGANTAVFSVVNRVLLEPLPYPHSQQLVAMRLSAPGAGGLADSSNGLGLSASMYLTFARNNQSLESMGIWTTGTANVTGLAQPEQVHTALMSGGLLETLHVPAAVGRWFTAAEQEPRGARTVMLSYGYWQRAFGGRRDVIGRTLQVDKQPREVVGIMPRGFRIADHSFDLLIPLTLDPVNEKLAGFGYDGIARLKSGLTLAQADADMARLIPVWMNSWTNGPGTNPHYYKRWRIAPQFRSLREQVVGGVSRMLWVVMATLAVVMLIACANIMNLLIVRAESRQQELSIRAALGAGRARIARELLTESIALALASGALAIGVAAAGLRLLVAVGSADLPRLSEISLSARAFVFTLVLSVLAGLLFGSVPVWKYTRDCNTLITGSASRTATESRTPAVSKCAGHCPDRDGARTTDQRAPYDPHVLTDNGTHFTSPGNTESAAPEIRLAIDSGEIFRAHSFEYACAQNSIGHRLTKPKHPWTNGQVERMNRTLKDATVRRFYYQTHDQLQLHLDQFVAAYNFARRLKTLQGLTPYEFICNMWTKEPQRFRLNPIHQTPGPNI